MDTGYGHEAVSKIGRLICGPSGGQPPVLMVHLLKIYVGPDIVNLDRKIRLDASNPYRVGCLAAGCPRRLAVVVTVRSRYNASTACRPSDASVVRALVQRFTGQTEYTMRKSILSRYRVDNVPGVIRLPYYLYGYGMGLLLFVVFAIFRLVVNVRVSGRESLDRHPNHIFCFWHSFVSLAMISGVPSIPNQFERAPQVWMQHPAWYMKPVHVLLRLMGVQRLALGSSGHEGRAAAQLLAGCLRQGYSTMMTPDGPYGPAFELKRGILHLSLNSGVPVVPVRYAVSRCWLLPTWDRKRLPRPGAMILLDIGDPIQVTGENFQAAAEQIARGMGVAGQGENQGESFKDAGRGEKTL